MTLFGKVEADLEIKSAAAKFHDVFGSRPHHTSTISPAKIQGCDLHEGEWGVSGSVVIWKYVHDGKACVAKEKIEAIDDENNSTTFKVIEGDLLDLYKNFKIVVHATPKEGGSLVHWTMEYEKLHDGIPDPTSLLEFAVHLSKDIDEHLQEQA